jgi:hypothetical protein
MKSARPPAGRQRRHGPSGQIPEREILPASSRRLKPAEDAVRQGMAAHASAPQPPEAPRD